MFILSILGILVACLLMAEFDRRRRERAERQSRIRWYTDDSHKSERVK